MPLLAVCGWSLLAFTYVQDRNAAESYRESWLGVLNEVTTDYANFTDTRRRERQGANH
jgi:hypothetical protein